MSKIQLWYAPGACSLAAHILLHEIGLPFEANLIALGDGAHLTDSFARLNAKRRVPVLSIDEAVITEVPAIMTAISDLAPNRQLFGQTAIARAKVYEWMAWLSGTVHGQGFGALWRPERFSAYLEHHDGIRAQGRATITAAFDFIEGKLAGSYAVGDRFTAADAYLLVFYRWGNGIGFAMPNAYPLYAALARHVAQRPAVRDAIAAEGIDALIDRVPDRNAA